MKKKFFEIEKDGFYGTYYEDPNGSDCTMIGLFGDDPNDYMAKCGAKWLHSRGVNVMCMSPGKKNYSHVNFPLERIQTAIDWLKSHGSRKVGIMGMSTAGMDSIAAASLLPDLTLTFGITASDFVWQGFEQGKKGRLRRVADTELFDAFLAGQAAAVYAFYLRAPRLLAENRGRN